MEQSIAALSSRRRLLSWYPSPAPTNPSPAPTYPSLAPTTMFEATSDSDDDADSQVDSETSYCATNRCILVFVFVGLFYISLYFNYRTFVWIENSDLISKDAPAPKPGHANVASRASSTFMPPDEGDGAGQTVELQEAQEEPENAVQEEPEEAVQEEPAQESVPVEDGGDTSGDQ